MAHKKILFREAAHTRISHGASQPADAVRVTLRPRSKSILIERRWGGSPVCNGGVTIAPEFGLATGRAVETLQALAHPVTTRREKAQVAAISAHNDSAAGDLVADAIDKIGDDGVIIVEQSKTTETATEIVEGMQFDRGFLSRYLVMDPEKMEAVLDECAILNGTAARRAVRWRKDRTDG